MILRSQSKTINSDRVAQEQMPVLQSYDHDDTDRFDVEQSKSDCQTRYQQLTNDSRQNEQDISKSYAYDENIHDNQDYFDASSEMYQQKVMVQNKNPVRDESNQQSYSKTDLQMQRHVSNTMSKSDQ